MKRERRGGERGGGGGGEKIERGRASEIAELKRGGKEGEVNTHICPLTCLP